MEANKKILFHNVYSIKGSYRKHLKTVLETLKLDKVLRFFLARKVVRKYFTSNYTSGYLAFAEQNNSLLIPPYWMTSNLFNGDFYCDFRDEQPLPLANDSQSVIYSAHMIEHLTAQALDFFIKESYRLLKPGGILRLDAPDSELVISKYKEGDDEYFYRMDPDRVPRFEPHNRLIGMISSYDDVGQTGVTASKEEVDRNVNSMNLKDFTDWCISLQTPEQLSTNGHKNAIYFQKLKELLLAAGFKQVSRVSNGKSDHPALKNRLVGIERPHRAFFSINIEATK